MVPLGYRLLCSLLVPLANSKILSVEGLENVDNTQPLLFAANHRSWLDPLYLTAAIRRSSRRRAFFIAATRRHRWTQAAIAIRQENRSATLVEALAALHKGNSVVFFPYGDPKSAWRHPMTGVARLSRMAHTPIIPVSITGVLSAKAKDAFPSFFRQLCVIRVRFGAPITLTHDAMHKQTLQRDMERVVAAIQQLTDQ